MNLRDLDAATIEAERIRSLQSRYPLEHAALLNWGSWSRVDTDKPRPARCHMFDQFDSSKVTAWGDEADAAGMNESAPVKAEAPETAPCDELRARLLDERINAAGMLALEIKRALTTAYVDGGPREENWWRYSGCSIADHFLERLEAGFRYVNRFI